MTQRGRSTERANSPRRAISPHPSLDPPSPDRSPVRSAADIDEYVADLEVTRGNLQAAIDAAQENCPLVAEIITNIKVRLHLHRPHSHPPPPSQAPFAIPASMGPILKPGKDKL